VKTWGEIQPLIDGIPAGGKVNIGLLAAVYPGATITIPAGKTVTIAAHKRGCTIIRTSNSNLFEVNGATITNAISSSSGSGVYAKDAASFKKEPASGSSTSGTIYGDTDTSHSSGDIENTASDGGHAVYFDNTIPTDIKKRNTTAGPSITLDSSNSTNWE
jgi:hypothetical protein